MYRAYYGDQLAIIFTVLELNSAPKDLGHEVCCIVCGENKILNFSRNPNSGYMCIPPASKRDDAKFMLDFEV